jgi:signal transduction histidine kinase
LLNLIRNAREAMPEGGPVALVARSLDGGVEVRVEDRGRGIPESTRARLFELFYSSKERGTGLGLSLTQQIVVAHRGRIRCEDAEGGGTAFTVWLPAFAGPSGRSGERPVPGDTRDP